MKKNESENNSTEKITPHLQQEKHNQILIMHWFPKTVDINSSSNHAN